MAVAQAYGKTVTSGSVFAYDVADTRNSYIGQPTTNIGNNFRDFTGTGYSPDGEWVSTEPTRFTKTYYPNLTTPIGPGGTLIEESGTGGYHHLSRYGGGSESGAHSLSCYIYPLVTGITDFCIGMLGDSNNNIRFNLDTKVITYGGGISNTNAFIEDVPGWPGWLRVGANIEGRGGGWVGCFGYTSYTTYTGTAGGKKAYITGIQYEYTTQPTPFVAGTRSATQALLPIVKNSTIDLTNISFDSDAEISLDGTSDRIRIDQDGNYFQPAFTWEMVVKFTSIQNTYQGLVWAEGSSQGEFGYSGEQYLLSLYNNQYFHYRIQNTTTGWTNTNTSAIDFNPLLYNHIVWQFYNGTTRIYINGKLFHTDTSRGSYSGGKFSPFFLGARNDGVFSSAIKMPVSRLYNRELSAEEVKQNFDFYDARFGIEVDTYYFVVSNRFSRSKWDSNGYTKVIADTTPAYIIYQKPDASFGNVVGYTEVASDPVGSPPKNTVFGVQYLYGSGRFLTTVTVHKKKKDGTLIFEFPDGGTSTYGEAFYKEIVTPYVP